MDMLADLRNKPNYLLIDKTLIYFSEVSSGFSALFIGSFSISWSLAVLSSSDSSDSSFHEDTS